MSGRWIVQCNPKSYKIFIAVSMGSPLRNFSVKQHRDRMAIGDDVALWISAGEPGYPAGVYAAGTIRSLHWPGTVDKRYWVSRDPGPDTFVDLDLDRNVFHHPISRQELSNDPDFASNLILAFPNQTSFPVSQTEWQAIDRRLSRRRPTRQPTLALARRIS